MTVALQAIPNPDSPLSRLDARWRLAALALAAGAVAALQSLPASAVAVAATLVLAACAHVPANWLLRRLGAMMPFLLMFILLVPFCVRDAEPLASWGPFTLSLRGLAVAAINGLQARRT